MIIDDTLLSQDGFFSAWAQRSSATPLRPSFTTLWTRQPQSHTLINHWGWASSVLSSSQFTQASSVAASAPGGWSPSLAPALAQGSGPAWHGWLQFRSQSCQPCILPLPVAYVYVRCGAPLHTPLLDYILLINECPFQFSSSPFSVQWRPIQIKRLTFSPIFLVKMPSSIQMLSHYQLIVFTLLLSKLFFFFFSPSLQLFGRGQQQD